MTFPSDDQRMACGYLCHKHFHAVPRILEVEAAACPDCIQARQDARDKLQREDTIIPSVPYGQHISLTCTMHPDLRWHTKNIRGIGARSIFFGSVGEKECDCHARFLVPVDFQNSIYAESGK